MYANHSPYGHLPRLGPEFYRGRAIVHWTLAIQNRSVGWLNALSHARFRELLAHALFRQSLACAAYCLMPDHAHLIWLGRSEASDQHKAMAFLRGELNRLLAPLELQKQVYDHVLRERDRERDAFQRSAHYVLENPVRKRLVERAEDYPYSGAMLVGYPRLNVHDRGYWDLFWRLMETQSGSQEVEPRADARGYERAVGTTVSTR